MTQEQFMKAESIVEKIRSYRELLRGTTIKILTNGDLNSLKINPDSDEYKDFESFIISQIMKFEDELKKI